MKLRKLELPMALLLFVSGSAFLLKMCYLSCGIEPVSSLEGLI